MIRMSYIDATFTDLEAQSSVISVKKFSAPFFVRKNGKDYILQGLVDGVMWAQGDLVSAIAKGSTTERKASLVVFEARFAPLSINGDVIKDVYCLKQPSLLALEMKHNFGVNVLITTETGEQDIVHKQGTKGDYLIQTAACTNDVITRKDFLMQYGHEQDGRVEFPQDVQIQLRSAIKKARDHSRALDASF